jgi:Xaa-Pro dipeptidase
VLLNRSRARELMSTSGVDAIVATMIENTYYFAGLWSMASKLFPRDTQVYVLVAADDLTAPIAVVPTTDADCVLDCFNDLRDVLTYGTFYRELFDDARMGENERHMKDWVIDREPFPNALSALVKAIQILGLTESCISIDESALNTYNFGALAERFPRAKFIPGAQLVKEIRAVKTSEEVRRLRLASEVNKQAMADAVSIAREGVTEKEMLIAYRTSLVQQGAQLSFECLNFGANTGFGNLASTDQKLRKGQHIRFDVGCRYLGYMSDLSRIFSYGDPGGKIRRYYNALRVGNEAGINALQPGRRPSEIFEVVVETVRQSGIPHYRRHHTGHGIGLEVYEPPLIAPNSNAVIEEGMTLAIEAPYFELGLGGLQIEDIVYVTKNGAEYLSVSNRDLVVLE